MQWWSKKTEPLNPADELACGRRYGRCDGSGWIAGRPALGYRVADSIPDDLLAITVVPCPACNPDGTKNQERAADLRIQAGA